jgi:hypothetical protein
MGTPIDPLRKLEAQRKLENLALQAGLTNLDAALAKLFTVTAPDLKTITTEQELRALIEAVRSGTADNNRLARFIEIATRVLGNA